MNTLYKTLPLGLGKPNQQNMENIMNTILKIIFGQRGTEMPNS